MTKVTNHSNQQKNHSTPAQNKKSWKQAKKADFKKRQLKKSDFSNQKTRKAVQSQVLAFNGNTYSLLRYPATDDPSLRAWSNAELLTLNYLLENQLLSDSSHLHLYNDRFGVWNCLLTGVNPNMEQTSIINYASQKKAIENNLGLNKHFVNTSTNTNSNKPSACYIDSPLDELKKVELALIKMPKSLELFELFLQQIHRASTDKTQVICCFMTKYFASSLLKIASRYFTSVEQTQAWKKARLLVLKQPKANVNYPKPINHISFNNRVYEQYYGVFSAEKVDIGTQFLLEQFNNGQLMVKSKEQKILDLACGNGVIAGELARQIPSQDVELTVIDDFGLAIESAKINLQDEQLPLVHPINFVCDDNLSSFSDNVFDLIVSNPPFHFEHENNIDVALLLFNDVRRVLKSNGRFILVANKHLHYQTHLDKIFNKVFVIKSNKKFEVYECLG